MSEVKTRSNEWKAEEDKYLVDNYKLLSTENLSETLGRSVGSIQARASKLGVKKEGKRWTEADEKYLINNYNTMDVDKIAKELNRTAESVYTRAGLLHLKKEVKQAKDFKDEIEKMVEAEYTVSQIAKKLNFSYSTINDFLKENNLKAVAGRSYDNKKAIDLGIEMYEPKELDPNTITLADYYKHWYNVYRKENLREVSKIKYRGVFTHLLEGGLGGLKLKNITRADIQVYVNKYGRSRSKKTVLDHMQSIRSCFKDAVLDGLIGNNPATNINPIYREQELSVVERKELRDQKKWLETEEYQKVRYYLVFTLQQILKEKPIISSVGNLQSSKQLLYMIIFIGLKTGMRLSEIVGLTANDFLTETKEISVDKTWNYRQIGTDDFQPTKNVSSVRKVLVDKETMDLFDLYVGWLNENNIQTNKGALFILEGRNFHNSTVNYALRTLLISLDIEPITMHKLRHTQASYLIAKGVPLQVVAKRLGHTDTNMIQKVYGHLLKETEDTGNKMILSLI